MNIQQIGAAVLRQYCHPVITQISAPVRAGVPGEAMHLIGGDALPKVGGGALDQGEIAEATAEGRRRTAAGLDQGPHGHIGVISIRNLIINIHQRAIHPLLLADDDRHRNSISRRRPLVAISPS